MPMLLHRRSIPAAIVLLLGVAPASASQHEPSHAEVREFLGASRFEEIGRRWLERALESYPPDTAHISLELSERVRDECLLADLTDVFVPFYASHFRRDELLEWTAAFKTPVGQEVAQLLIDLAPYAPDEMPPFEEELSEDVSAFLVSPVFRGFVRKLKQITPEAEAIGTLWAQNCIQFVLWKYRGTDP